MSSSSKQPKKKRRIDGDQESLPGPSAEVTPPVAPQVVKKSSRNSKRRTCLSNKGKSNSPNHSSSPEFIKASELCRRRAQNVKARRTPVNSDSDKSVPVENLPDLSGINSKTTSTLNSRLQFSNSFTKGKYAAENLLSSGNSTIKITRCFQSSDSSKKRVVKSITKPRLRRAALTRNLCLKEKKVPVIVEDNDRFKNYNCYGLVENSETVEVHDYFTQLPTHIIETILCQIPMSDFEACRFVCTRFREIVDNVKFMEWKKLYYKYKKDCANRIVTTQIQLKKLTESLDHATVEDCIKTLMKFMGKTFNRIPCSEMYGLLVLNRHGELADQVLTERFTEWDGKHSRVWCQLALAVIISETVWDIFDVYRSLFSSKLSCSRTDVIDAMYCVATFLLYYQYTYNINCGLHYRVYYALYLIENHVPKFQREKLKTIPPVPGQQSIYNFGERKNCYLTFEQIRILNHQFDMNQKIRIIALAGTGKTTTLVHLARLYPQIKFLNLVLNRSVNEHAKKKFPPNVTCMTAHSLAFGAVGKDLRHKLTTSVRPYDLLGHLQNNHDNIQIYAYANLVLTAINNFIMSTDTAMNLEHVPNLDIHRKVISFENRDRILKDAQQIWVKMIDQFDVFKITHDVYLKLYQLKLPSLTKYQCIMVDEAQDCNPVILSIVLSQNMPVILVGDPHQQIYGFRGARNALQQIPATHTYYLTKSFRFGPEISYIASCVLETLVNAKRDTIVGSTEDSFINGNVDGQYAIISRTNIKLFNEALRMVVFRGQKSFEPTVIRAAFAGGFSSYGFDQISDIYKLKYLPKAERKLKDKFICRFKTYNDLYNYAKYSDDADLLSKIEIVNQHGHDISRFISILKQKCSSSMDRANVVFSTAHKSKGLEFNSVCLTDDYPISILESDEANILYVALTRAKRCLILPEKISKVLQLAREKFEYPVSSKLVLKNSADLKCVLCERSFVPHTVLLMMRHKIVMASGREIKKGPLCIKCGSDPFMRPDVHMNGLVMYLDPAPDFSHRFMASIVGPLPNDAPIVHDRFSEFENADQVFVINLNL